MFGLWTPELLMFDPKIGFLIENCIYSQLEISRIRKFDENTSKINFLGVVVLNFEVWVKDLEVFDLRFGFGMPKSPWGQVLR